MRQRCSGIAASRAVTSAMDAVGRSAGRSTPAPLVRQGEESNKSSATAVRKIAESKRYAFAAVDGWTVAKLACQERIAEGVRPVSVT